MEVNSLRSNTGIQSYPLINSAKQLCSALGDFLKKQPSLERWTSNTSLHLNIAEWILCWNFNLNLKTTLASKSLFVQVCPYPNAFIKKIELLLIGKVPYVLSGFKIKTQSAITRLTLFRTFQRNKYLNSKVLNFGASQQAVSKNKCLR